MPPSSGIFNTPPFELKQRGIAPQFVFASTPLLVQYTFVASTAMLDGRGCPVVRVALPEPLIAARPTLPFV